MTDSIKIADEVTALLNEAALSVPITAQRKVMPLFELKDLADLKVTVSPKAIDVEPNSRESGQYNYDVYISVQRKLENIEQDIGGLISLVMEIIKYLRGKPLAVCKALWVKSVIDPVYSTEHLQSSVFTSIITVTYKVIE